MQAYKLKGKIDAAGNLVITEPIKLPSGDVEVIVLQVVATTIDTPKQLKKREYKVQALKDLLENAPPTPPDFDPEQARWEALKEKHNL